ncbi:hypothetical protein [Serratia fonticola]|uniref:Uncharacterized protein n=1 Tax=Serratia fonticola TaxID=47917 RepID=A0AAE7EFG1_SERFO|nr:hypothetical protein [Serratia fonticola]QKJ57605.1 hypothetical protein G9399_03360 [Serratia fonticola]
MSYANIVSTTSLVVALVAFALPFWRDHQAKQKAKRKEMIDVLTRSGWSNEGDILTIPKAHYTVEFSKIDGISNIVGTMHINLDERFFDFIGKVDAKGVLKTTLRMPLGKFGVEVAKVKFIYSEEDDQITYKFEGFIGPTEMAQENDVLDTKQLLWRSPT